MPDFSAAALEEGIDKILGEVLKMLTELGLDPHGASKTADDVRGLVSVIVDPDTKQDSREAAWRALQGLPLRVRQQIVFAEKSAQNQAEALLEGFLGVVEHVVRIVTMVV